MNCSLFRILLLTAALRLTTPWVEGASNVGPPNILWHNQVTGQTRVWLMNGTTFSSEVALPATTDDLNWQMVGTGDFDGNGSPDIVWQNLKTGQNAVWFMTGTIMTSAALIQSAGDLSWRMVGVADFNGDGKPDLLWQNLTTAQNVVWFMNGTSPTSYNFIVSNGDPNWRIMGTGDMNGDGKPDIVLRNLSTGQNAIWFMNGLTLTSGQLIRASNGGEATETDQDWRIMGTGDYNGDGKIDLFWRHTTLGICVTWFLNNGVLAGTSYLSRHEFNTDWKNCGQDLTDSTWRLSIADYTYLRASVQNAPTKVVLTFKLPTNSGFGVTVQRRLSSEPNYTTLATGFAGTAYTDTSPVAGNRYEYRVYREGFGGSQYSAAEHTSVALNAAAIENRGKVILLVDQTLTNQLGASLDQLNRDLVGDGWTTVRYDVPRHVDDYSTATSYKVNANNVQNVIKPLIRSAYANDPSNTKAILIVGHVAIPYSGTFPVDGHTCGAAPVGPDHQGAWVADMYYGDLDGTWTDNSANYTNCSFPEPTNLPGDGKFDQDGIASPFVLKLAVGRIDFARLPIFTANPPAGIAARSEATLIQQYLNKDHLYRAKLLTWQTGNPAGRGIVYGNFHDSRDDPIFENAANTMIGITADTNSLTVGDFVLQGTRPYLWGFMSGSGSLDRVNNSAPIIEHTAADLASPSKEPTTAFYMILASYMGDWNLSTNNYLRALLTTPNYGLASMWTRRALWRTDALGIGEHLGGCETRMVNDPKESFYDRSRELSILGDLTLRLHVVAPPTNPTAVSMKGKVQLTWSGSEAGAQFYVYRGASMNGPFTRISNSAVTGTSFADTLPSPKQKVYMIRALKPVTTANGSYTDISQGAFVQSN